MKEDTLYLKNVVEKIMEKLKDKNVQVQDLYMSALLLASFSYNGKKGMTKEELFNTAVEIKEKIEKVSIN